MLGALQYSGVYLECDARVHEARVAQAPSILTTLQEYADVFNKEAAATLLNFKLSDYAILLIEGKELLYGLLYNLSLRELKVLREYLE